MIKINMDYLNNKTVDKTGYLTQYSYLFFVLPYQ